MGGSQSGQMYNTPEEAEEFVKKTISSHPVVLFTKRFSPYCYKATSSFKKINVTYEEILLSGRSDCQIIQDVLLKMTGARTVPRVFVHGNCIGGGDETKALFVEGKLKEIVDKQENATAGAEQNADDPSEQNADQPSEQNAEEPSEQNAEEPSEQNSEKATEKSTEVATEQTTEAATEQNTEQSSDQITEKVEEQKTENAAE